MIKEIFRRHVSFLSLPRKHVIPYNSIEPCGKSSGVNPHLNHYSFHSGYTVLPLAKNENQRQAYSYP